MISDTKKARLYSATISQWYTGTIKVWLFPVTISQRYPETIKVRPFKSVLPGNNQGSAISGDDFSMVTETYQRSAISFNDDFSVVP